MANNGFVKCANGQVLGSRNDVLNAFNCVKSKNSKKLEVDCKQN
jgi:hypothetical protein